MVGTLRIYIKFHARIFLNFYRFLLFKSDKEVFAFLFNLKSFFIGGSSRLKWDGSHFMVTDKAWPMLKRKIRHQETADMFYEYGITHRAETIGKAYFLNDIEFKDRDVFLDCGANVGDLEL